MNNFISSLYYTFRIKSTQQETMVNSHAHEIADPAAGALYMDKVVLGRTTKSLISITCSN